MVTDYVIRSATAADAPGVAAVNAASWRATYRGILTDAYLDGPIEADRLGVWQERLADGATALVEIACRGDEIVGFACAFAAEDETWGSRIDNLHVLPAHRRQHLASRLMRALAARLHAAEPDLPVYLWVYNVNDAARATYESLGGTLTEQGARTGADGTTAPALRYTWPRPSLII